MPLDLMIDLETMGQGPDAAILQIGIVPFDPLRLSIHPGDVEARNVDLQSCLDAGLRVDGETFRWWMKQSDAARQSVAGRTGISLSIALGQVAVAWRKNCDENRSRVWAAPASFDLVILSHAFRRFGQSTPWDFRRQRCLSSVGKCVGFPLKNLPDVPVEFQLEHDAGCDAARQAMACQQLHQYLRAAGIKTEAES